MTLGSHQRSVGQSQSWITPRWILDGLGPFDLDPCASDPQPWPCARRSYAQLGLERGWAGMVWLNPPFDRYEITRWVKKMAHHNNGIMLTHARTETEWFRLVWDNASSIFFFADRIKFCRPDGTTAKANSGAPPCLAAFGDEADRRLQTATFNGVLVTKWTRQAAKK
jgi:hypothetical protein